MDFSLSELNFNSVVIDTVAMLPSIETPGFEARAAFTVNSATVFREEVDIVPTIVDDTLSYIPWGGDWVIGLGRFSRMDKFGMTMFEVTPLTLAELLVNLDWLGSPPNVPVRPEKINRCQALPADFQRVPFESFIVCDNYYRGFLQTQQDYLLDEMGRVMYQDECAVVRNR